MKEQRPPQLSPALASSWSQDLGADRPQGPAGAHSAVSEALGFAGEGQGGLLVQSRVAAVLMPHSNPPPHQAHTCTLCPSPGPHEALFLLPSFRGARFSVPRQSLMTSEPSSWPLSSRLARADPVFQTDPNKRGRRGGPGWWPHPSTLPPMENDLSCVCSCCPPTPPGQVKVNSETNLTTCLIKPIRSKISSFQPQRSAASWAWGTGLTGRL